MAHTKNTDDKQAYEQLVAAELDEWQAKIDQIAARLNRADAKVKIELHEELNDLKHAAKRKFEQLRGAGQDSWRDFRREMDSARTRLAVAVQSAADRIA